MPAPAHRCARSLHPRVRVRGSVFDSNARGSRHTPAAAAAAQDDALLDNLTVEEHLVLYARLRGFAPAAVPAVVGVLIFGDTTRAGLAPLAVVGFGLSVAGALALARFGELNSDAGTRT